MDATQISRYADAIMTLIKSDVEAGIVPASVRSFSELHDYVDANDYGLEAVPFSGPKCTCTRTLGNPGCHCEHYDAWCAYGEDLNEVETEVSRRLATGTAL